MTMPITFNTNLAAQTSQRYLSIASDKTKVSLAKLSSGSRVPTAKDDAAALAIGSKLKAEVAGLNQASNNASQAVSLLQIADGALSTTNDLLVRMKALAVQSSSGQLSDSDRSLLNQEFTNLRSEIDRIAQVTNFNGNTLLNGGDVVAATTEGKGGFLASKGISVSYDTAVTGADAVFRVSYDYTDNTNTNGTAEADTGNLTVTNLTTGASQTIDISSLVRAQSGETTTADGSVVDTTLTTAIPVGKNVEVNFSALGVKLNLDNTFALTTDFNTPAQSVTVTSPASTLGGTVTVTYLNNSSISGTNFAAILAGGDYTANSGILGLQVDSTATLNKVSFAATAGIQFSADNSTFANTLATQTVGSAGNVVYIRAGTTGTAFARIDLSAASSTTTANTAGTYDVNLGGLLREVESTSTAKSFTFKVGTGTSSNDSIAFTLNAGTTAALGISGATIDTTANANSAITTLSNAITTASRTTSPAGPQAAPPAAVPRPIPAPRPPPTTKSARPCARRKRTAAKSARSASPCCWKVRWPKTPTANLPIPPCRTSKSPASRRWCKPPSALTPPAATRWKSPTCSSPPRRNPRPWKSLS